MMHLRIARAAMVALTAIGMTFTTTTHAADFASGATIVYGDNRLQDPGNPTVPGYSGPGASSGNVTVPGYSGPGVDNRPDIKVTYVKGIHLGAVHHWHFLIENVGKGKATSVTLHPQVSREGQNPEDRAPIPLGEMAPGTKHDVLISCTDVPGTTPCLMAWVYAWLGQTQATWLGNDANKDNNWAHSFYYY